MSAAGSAERVTGWLAVVVGVVGAMVFVVGWWLGVDSVTRLLPGLSSMKANAAVGFLLAAVALHPGIRGTRRPVADAAAALLTALGLATAAEWTLGVDLGIDQLLAADSADGITTVLGRPGLNTSIGFVLLGLAIAAADPRARRSLRVMGQAFGLVTAVLALVAVLGYVVQAGGDDPLSSATEMALHTSVLFLLVAGAVGSSTVDVGLLSVLRSSTDIGRSARLLLPVSITAILGGVVLVQLLATTSLLSDPALQLAFQATASIIVITLAGLIGLRRLEESERRADASRSQLQALRDAFPVVNLRLGDGRVLGEVHGDLERFGYGRGAPGVGISEVAPRAAVGPLLDAARATLASGAPVDLTYVVDGGGHHEAQVAPLDDGEVAVAVRDVTELAAARAELLALAGSLEEQVQQRTAELQRANAALERFVYIASHDLQEPLRMVSGFVTRLGDRYGDQLDDRGQQYVHFAVDGAERMRLLIEGLLAYSRAGRLMDDRVAAVDLDLVVDQVVASMSRGIAEAGAALEQQRGGAVARADPTLMRQVVENLVANALKFSREGEPPRVMVGTAADGDEAVVWVEDDGIGIAEEHRAEVFEMFRRVSPEARHRGTGIGLSLVDQIVRSHGGSVTIGDASGPHGTRFEVRLPAAPAPAPSGAVTEEQA